MGQHYSRNSSISIQIGIKLTKEEAQFPSHISLVRIDHVGNSYSHDYAHECLNGGRNGDSLRADFCGGSFADNYKADGADS